MENRTKTTFSLDYFLVQEFKLKQSPSKAQQKIDLDISPSGVYFSDKRKYQLQLVVRVKDINGRFNIDLTAIAVFIINQDNKEADFPDYFYLNATAIVFPYIRSYISSISALSGINTINLPIMNLSHLENQLKENTILFDDNPASEAAPKSSKSKKK